MLKTYKARLKDDRLEWLESPPATAPTATGVDVYVTMLPGDIPLPTESARSGEKMVAALERLAGMGGLAEIIPDPVAWQREQREDRPLHGRD